MVVVLDNVILYQSNLVAARNNVVADFQQTDSYVIKKDKDLN
jgi:hypothetical protein